MADFKVGDVVVKVGGPCTRMPRGIIVRVVKIWPHQPHWGNHEGDGLELHGWPTDKFGWNSNNFRHLPKADEQFTQQIRALRPVKGRQDA